MQVVAGRRNGPTCARFQVRTGARGADFSGQLQIGTHLKLVSRGRPPTLEGGTVCACGISTVGDPEAKHCLSSRPTPSARGP